MVKSGNPPPPPRPPLARYVSQKDYDTSNDFSVSNDYKSFQKVPIKFKELLEVIGKEEYVTSGSYHLEITCFERSNHFSPNNGLQQLCCHDNTEGLLLY